MSLIAGVDIGGTKCAVSLGSLRGEQIEIHSKIGFPTPPSPQETIDLISAQLHSLLLTQEASLAAIGISCGGPLDSKAGIILSPPNLPSWDKINVVSPLQKEFQVPVALQNDANACALAEWKWGAGQGSNHVIFLTFGTGMGAGLILNGQLYTGSNDLAGEVGHVRLQEDGPIGYGKAGSFEGYCSGGGIARLAQQMADERLRRGETPLFCPTSRDVASITAHKVGEAAQQGDPLAKEILTIVGKRLGQGLAMLIDILNPEKIIIGSIYGRQRSLLESVTLGEVKKEALPHSVAACRIVPAGLGEQVGDYASLSVAYHQLLSS